MHVEDILRKAVFCESLNFQEVELLYKDAQLSQLTLAAHELRLRKAHPEIVSWIIDRNVNITNVCCSACLFCNFYTGKNSENAFITSEEEYIKKIRELKKIGGNQLLLQGGLHPELGLNYYTSLFSRLKQLFPRLKLHALGPPEIIHLAKKEGLLPGSVLKKLVDAGLDSLPGAGAEILSDRVRGIISKAKCTTSEWLNVMHEAHKMNITTSATMMYGHVETIDERINHLLLLRDLQSQKPKESKGFISFTPWPFQHKNTRLHKKTGITANFSADEYIRIIALSRLVLNNIDNIQASWLTVGKELAQVCLHCGANDLSSIMIEENVVSSAGANYIMGVQEMEETIKQAGFIPVKRDQQYNFLK